MTDIQCQLCQTTIVPHAGEVVCFPCMDKLLKASEALQACGQYSIENPTIPLNENPHYVENERTRKEIGSVLWGCEHCTLCNPPLKIWGDMIVTACCERNVIILSDFCESCGVEDVPLNVAGLCAECG